MNPRDFLRIADSFRASGDEAERRTSIGRSYYCLFNSLRDTLAAHGVRFAGDATDHELLARHLTRNPNREAAKIGAALVSLRNQRNEADYRMQVPIRAEHSQLAFRRAQEYLRIFDSFNQAALVSIVGGMR